MPIAAIASIGMGASAIAAGGLSTFGMISSVGAIVGGIGALTGSKELTMLGGIAALAGGVGAFAQGKGWIAGAGSGSALSDTAASNTSLLTKTPTPGLEPVQDFGTAAGSNSVELGLMDSMDPGAASSAVEGSIQQSIAQASPATQAMGAGPAAGAVGSLTGPTLAANQLPSNVLQPSGSVFDVLRKFNDFLPQDKESRAFLFNMIGGAFDSRKAAETDLLKAREEEIRTQMRNGSDIPTMSARLNQRGPIFPSTRPTYQAPRVGLMNAG